MKDKRINGQSQLDYLWTTYGGFNISSTINSSNLDESIPSQALLIDLLQKLGNKLVGSISLKNTDLVLYNQSGLEISRIDVSELTSKQISIIDFGQKIVQNTDIANGCPFPLYTKVYYITLSNGRQFWAKQDVLDGFESSTIKTQIIDNHIVSSLKIDKTQGNVVLTDKSGLKATLPISGLGLPIQFKFITQEDYDNLVNPETGTVYFIDGKTYLYFGSTKIGAEVDLIEVVSSLPVIGDQNKIYLIERDSDRYDAYIRVNNRYILIGNVGDNTIVEERLNTVETIITWKNYG